MASAHPVILFDAECVLCSASAQFILKHDRAGRFRLASMQGAVGAGLSRRHGEDPKNASTIVVIDGENVLRESDAVIFVCASLGWPWRIAGMLHAIPQSWRNPAYRWIARNRYRIFGKRDVCWMPSSEDSDRVL